MSYVQRFLMARRADSESGVSLRKRRKWYADDPATDAGKATGDQKPADKSEADGEKTFSAAYVKELRDEAADWRKKHKALESRLNDLESKTKTEEDKKLTDQQQYKELADKKTAEANDWKAKYEAAEQKSLKLQVAVELKLPPALANRLVGTTEEELRADAAELAKLIPQQQATTPQGDKPTDKTEGGDKGTPADAGRQQTGGSQQTTTGVPGGQPKSGDTDADRKARYFGAPGAGKSPLFQGAKIVYHGDQTDLEK